MEKSDISRFVLSDPSEIVIEHLGKHWLEQPEGNGRTLPAQLTDVPMSEEEFLEKSTPSA